ncbi:MAG TPA: cytochrome c oxidase subunit II [Gemmatimonadaceae bacterium]
MPLHLRPVATRVTRAAALTAALLALSACAGTYPNSIFHGRSDFNRDAVGYLFNLILWLGVVVFVLVEGLLLYTMWKYRSRPGQREPEHVHGNTTLEITWTVIPALILAWIAIPTVRTIFRTEAAAPANALHVEVTGHQWWWEFRIPEYNVVTANELYLPLGRPVDFKLQSVDVIHSFWIPALAGKRDVIPNRVNHIWFTPDSTSEKAFNGVCVEYCGTSHANMRFRAFVVSPQEFESWAKYQATPAAYNGTPAPVTPPATKTATTKTATKQAPPAVAAPVTVAQTGYVFPADQMPAHIIPTTPVPADLTFDDQLLAQGDPSKAQNWLALGGCVGCHTIGGNKMMVGIAGPNLTHVGSRNTIGAGLFPNDAKHLALWIKNARRMKPGIVMPTIGKGQIDPATGKPTTIGQLTDQQIADIVAYLRALK